MDGSISARAVPRRNGGAPFVFTGRKELVDEAARYTLVFSAHTFPWQTVIFNSPSFPHSRKAVARDIEGALLSARLHLSSPRRARGHYIPRPFDLTDRMAWAGVWTGTKSSGGHGARGQQYSTGPLKMWDIVVWTGFHVILHHRPFHRHKPADAEISDQATINGMERLRVCISLPHLPHLPQHHCLPVPLPTHFCLPHLPTPPHCHHHFFCLSSCTCMPIFLLPACLSTIHTHLHPLPHYTSPAPLPHTHTFTHATTPHHTSTYPPSPAHFPTTCPLHTLCLYSCHHHR